jgi:GTP-binding protein EngB required for normal cell division
MKIVRTIIFIIFFLNIFNLSHNKLLAIIGQADSGKSCFINTITGKNLAEVGHEDEILGITKSSTIYYSNVDGFEDDDEYALLDSIGLTGYSNHDSYSLADSTMTISNYLNESNSNLSSILFFHTLNDYENLENNLKYLNKTLGPEIFKSTILIINKNNDANEEQLKNLLQNYDGLKYVHWKSKCSISISDIYYQQIEDLYQKISNTDQKDSKFFYDKIENLKNEIYNNEKPEEFEKMLKTSFSFKNFCLSVFGFISLPIYLNSGLYSWQKNQLKKVGTSQNILELSILNQINNK